MLNGTRMRILDLNLDCMLRILSYCNDRDLANLSRVCGEFSEIIDNNIYYVKSLDLLMCGHRGSPSISARTFDNLSFSNRLSISSNWINGRYRESVYFHHKKMFPTKIFLEKDHFYITHAGYMRIHKRLRSEPLQRLYLKEIASSSSSDISDFVKKRDTIFAGRVCGSCFIHENDYTSDQRLHNVKEYLQCVDFANDLYVTSTDRCSKLWRRSNELGLIHLDLVKESTFSYKVLRFNDRGDLLYGGLYTDLCRRALREIDIETGVHKILNSNTISIYDLKLKDDNVIFTANFDTTFRMFDRRTNHDASIWDDPFDSSFYCLDYDGLYAVLCGTKYHSRVNLYDIRMPKKYIQLYFPIQRNKGSPVYSIACDSRYLFVATDHNLKVFDFKASWAINRDYRDVFKQMTRV